MGATPSVLGVYPLLSGVHTPVVPVLLYLETRTPWGNNDKRKVNDATQPIYVLYALCAKHESVASGVCVYCSECARVCVSTHVGVCVHVHCYMGAKRYATLRVRVCVHRMRACVCTYVCTWRKYHAWCC